MTQEIHRINRRPSPEAAAKVIGLMGGPVQAARALGIPRYQTVQSWAVNGVPVHYCAACEQIVDGKVMRWDLYPDDWRAIWPELKALANAPQPASMEGEAA